MESRRLAADLAHRAAYGRTGLDLRGATAAVVAADGLVVATPVPAGPPGGVFDSFFAVLGDGVLSGTPVLLALDSGTAALRATADGDAGRLRTRIDRAAAELAAAMRSHRR